LKGDRNSWIPSSLQSADEPFRSVINHLTRSKITMPFKL